MKKSLSLILSLAFASSSFGATITTLFNTGVDASGTPLADGEIDPHYLLVAPGAEEGQPFIATAGGGFPVPPWVGDNSDSAWTTTLNPTTPLGPGSNTPAGIFADFYYETTFSMSGLNPSSAVIAGQVSYDNFLQDVLINGVSSGISAPAANPGPSFGGWLPFAFDAADVALLKSGSNTLTFIVRSAATDGNQDYTGVRVEFSQRDAAVIPEPSSLALLSAGLLALGRRRR